MDTLLLDTLAWDLVLDINGNIAMASDPYSQAQDAASVCRLFNGELYYDTTRGIPYFTQIIGKLPPLTLIKTYYTSAVLDPTSGVPGVVAANVFITALSPQRVLSGQVQITNDDGETSAAGF